LEQMLAEPSDAGLGATIDNFFTSWADLASDPSASTRRATVREQGRILADRFGNLARQVERMRTEISQELRVEVEQFNLTLSEIKTISGSIRASGLRGLGARDLEDRRDALLDELARVTDISYGTREDGDFYLRVDGKLLMDESTFRPLELVKSDVGAAESKCSLRIGTGTPVDTGNGSLGALFELHDETLPDFMDKIDDLAKTLIDNINAIHRSGPSRADFFAGDNAASMSLSADIESSLSAINTSTTGLAGDNDIALAIAQLRDAGILTEGTASPIEYWSGVVGRVGVISREAQVQEETLGLTSQALEGRREESNGVSLDEEMANLIQTQQVYLAAVRLFEIAGDMMDVLTKM
ncbi:MAG: flagellar hook-associated protein FlgK, partial [Actinobacteria bacterium]|nr:flagellar hook-associated protein FlgK [Actinomycetota bacterium]